MTNKIFRCCRFLLEFYVMIMREVCGPNLGPVKSDSELPTSRHRFDISSKEAVLSRHNEAKMGPANSLHASTLYSEYNERLDLIMAQTVYALHNPLLPNMLLKNIK